MDIYRDEHAQQFVTVANTVARDSRLTLRASGLLLHFLSLPPGWHMTLEDLAETRPEGVDAIKSAFRELRAVGYARVIDQRDSRGRLHRKVKIFETPQPVDSPATAAATAAEVPLTEPRKTHFRSDLGKQGVSAGRTESGFTEPRSSHSVLKTDTKDGRKTVGSTAVERVGAKHRSHDVAQPDGSATMQDRILRDVRTAISQVHGERENVITDDEDVLRLWEHYKPQDGRRVRNRVAYMAKVLSDFQYVDGALGNCEELGDEDEGVSVGAYWRCSRCAIDGKQTLINPHSATGLCSWCEDPVAMTADATLTRLAKHVAAVLRENPDLDDKQAANAARLRLRAEMGQLARKSAAARKAPVTGNVTPAGDAA